MSIRIKSILVCSAFALSSQNVLASELSRIWQQEEKNFASMSSPLSLITCKTHLTKADLQEAKLLISQKADVNGRCYFKRFPLYYVTDFNHDRFTSVNLKFMKLLLSNGAGRPMLSSRGLFGLDSETDVLLERIDKELEKRADQIATLKAKIESKEEEFSTSHPSFGVVDRDILGFSLDFKGISDFEEQTLPNLKAELKRRVHQEQLAKYARLVLDPFKYAVVSCLSGDSQVLPPQVVNIVIQYMEDATPEMVKVVHGYF